METIPRHWPFAREIHRSPVVSPHKDQWRGALMFALIYAWEFQALQLIVLAVFGAVD